MRKNNGVCNNSRIAFLFIIFFCVCSLKSSTAQSDRLFHLAKSYAAIQYFYPDPQLSKLNWDHFLIHQVSNILIDSSNFENTFRELFPQTKFRTSKIKESRILPPEALSNNHYYQHFGGIETIHGESLDELMKSLLIGGDLKSFSMLFRLLPMTKRINHRVKLGFHAKWESQKSDSALVMLHCGFKENGKINSRYHKIYIKPCSAWTYYELDTLFCSNCPSRIFNSLKIIRPEHDTLLIDDLLIFDQSTNDTIFFHGFENYDTLYHQFAEYQAFIWGDKIAPKPSVDSYNGDYSLKLIGNQHLQLYPQNNLDSFIQVSLDTNYWLDFPRFINKKNAYHDIEHALMFYNKLNVENYPDHVIFIADLLKLWAIAENTYPYPHIRKHIDAKALLKNCIIKALQTDYSESLHFQNIVYLHSAYRDPHLNPRWKHKTPLHPPVIPQIIDGKYCIGKIYAEEYSSFFGQEVTHINGENIDDWLDKRLYQREAINSTHLLNNAFRYLFYSYDKPTSYHLLLRNGEALFIDSTKLISKKKAILFPYSYLNDTIQIIGNKEAIYINISRFGKWDKRGQKRQQYIRDSLSQYPWIILDFRNNHINYTSQRVIEKAKRVNGVFVKPDFNSIIDQPFNDTFASIPLNLYDLARYEISRPEFSSKIIALVNENTRSAPERHLLPLYDKGLITIIGQPTAGTASFSNKLHLPSGIKVSFTMGRTTYENGTPYQDNGMQPHHLILNSLSDQDLGLMKAKELISKQKQ